MYNLTFRDYNRALVLEHPRMYNVQLMYNGNNVQLKVSKLLNGQIVNKL